jgi:hypothetical protein
VSALFWAGTWVGVGYVLQASMTAVTATAASVGVWLTVEIAAVLLAYGAVKCGTRRDSARGDEPMSGAPVADVAMSRAPEVCS